MGSWKLSGTEIYSRLDRTKVAVSENMDFYLIDFRENRILKYDRNGQLLRSIGQKGEGPGDFRGLWSVRYHQGVLYAFDTMSERVSLFAPNGDFLRSLPVPRSAVISITPVQKIINGWAYYDLEADEVILLDEDFGEATVLARGPHEVLPDLEARNRIKLVPERSSFSVNKDGSRLFLYNGSGEFLIEIYDVVKKQVIGRIAKDIPRVAFDKVWGEAVFEKTVARRTNLGSYQGVTFEPVYPDFLPVIVFLDTDPDGNLMVRRDAIVNKDAKALVFDENGKETDSRFPVHHLSKIIAVVDEWAYVATYHDEEFGIERILVSSLKDYNFSG